MKRLLLTGAAGFIGRHMPALLTARGFEVHAISQHVRDNRTEGVVWHQADLLDTTETCGLVEEIRASHLLHLAWYTEHGEYWEAAENLDWVAATLHLARSFRGAGGERLVAAGTCAEYEWKYESLGAGTYLQPSTLYGVAKDATRRVLEAFAAEVGLSFVWGRVFFPYGPGERLRDFLYVDDVASAFAALVSSEATGCFDIGSGQGVPLRDVLLTLEELAGVDGIIRLGAVQDRDEPASIVADATQLRNEVGWQPCYELRDGLERTLEWWREAILAPHP